MWEWQPETGLFSNFFKKSPMSNRMLWYLPPLAHWKLFLDIKVRLPISVQLKASRWPRPRPQSVGRAYMDVQKRKMLNVWLWPKVVFSVKYLNIRHILRHCDDVIASRDVEHRGKYQPLAKVYSSTLPMNIYNIYHSLLLTPDQSIEPVRFWPVFRQSPS